MAGELSSELGLLWQRANCLSANNCWRQLLDGKNVLLGTFYPNLEAMGFDGSFVYTYGQSLMGFYAEFDEFHSAPIRRAISHPSLVRISRGRYLAAGLRVYGVSMSKYMESNSAVVRKTSQSGIDVKMAQAKS